MITDKQYEICEKWLTKNGYETVHDYAEEHLLPYESAEFQLEYRDGGIGYDDDYILENLWGILETNPDWECPSEKGLEETFKKFEKYVFNTILVHVARTWERIRVEQPHQDMGIDNIESVDVIVSIADEILKDSVIRDFIENDRTDWDWDEKTGEGCSDIYIENLAHKIISVNYLDN